MTLSWAQRLAQAEDKFEHLLLLANNEFDFPELSEEIRSQFNTLKDKKFRIAVIGEFNHGKSTFLNALLGEKCFPTDLLPNTAVVTQVVFAEEKYARVFYRDGQKQDLSISTWQSDYSLTQADLLFQTGQEEDRFDNVDYVELGYPLELCQNKVILVDTPGLNEDLRRTIRVLGHLDDVDAIIFMLWVPQLFGELEKSVVDRYLLPAGLNDIFFVLNGWNLVAAMTDVGDIERQQEEITARARVRLAEYVSDEKWNQYVFLLDALSATKGRLANPPNEELITRSGILALEKSIANFLAVQREQVLLKRTRSRLGQLKEIILNYLALQKRNSEVSESEIEGVLKTYEIGLKNTEDITNYLTNYLEQNLAEDQNKFIQEVKNFSHLIVQELSEITEANVVPSEDVTIEVDVQKLKVLLGEKVDDEVTKWLSGHQQWLEEIAVSQLSQVQDYTAQLLEKVAEHLGRSNLFDWSAPSLNWQGFYLKVKEAWVEAFLVALAALFDRREVESPIEYETLSSKFNDELIALLDNELSKSLTVISQTMRTVLLEQVHDYLELVNHWLRDWEAASDKLGRRVLLDDGTKEQGRVEEIAQKVEAIFADLDICFSVDEG